LNFVFDIAFFLFCLSLSCLSPSFAFFFLHAPASTEIYTLSLHDALPIYGSQPSQPYGSQPGQNQNPYGQNAQGQDPYGQGQYGQGQDPYGQGQDPYGQGQYDANQYGQNPYDPNAQGYDPNQNGQQPAYAADGSSDQFSPAKPNAAYGQFPAGTGGNIT